MTTKTQSQLIQESFELLAKHGYTTREQIGKLNELATTDKTSIVAALNELKASAGNGNDLNFDDLPQRVKNLLDKGTAE